MKQEIQFKAVIVCSVLLLFGVLSISIYVKKRIGSDPFKGGLYPHKVENLTPDEYVNSIPAVQIESDSPSAFYASWEHANHAKEIKVVNASTRSEALGSLREAYSILLGLEEYRSDWKPHLVRAKINDLRIEIKECYKGMREDGE
ncbi:hypothetical protein JO972_15970 [Verrucomicrobiaceae bacterium 5K15]|uniref:Uncharacterized protein n=1 Tax=Oceaniferula flava TaxID=2800421 RepID=A0AAE2VDX9_9BACT|nr:hypothetical protein [Oceaniferula flavus]MBK1856466.1 hypothetical protein [Oceaniferula flavus]MBM1137773.1 hypothetical protein [Oceaniferula flavus]